MDHYVISAIVLGLILSSAALGSYVRLKMPDHHFDEASLGAMRIAVGLVATLSALVLSLLISSGKSSLDLVNTALERNTVTMIRLDRTLAQFGPSTDDLRAQIKKDYARWITFLFSSTTGKSAEAESREIIQSTYDIQELIFAIQRRRRFAGEVAGQCASSLGRYFCRPMACTRTQKGLDPDSIDHDPRRLARRHIRHIWLQRAEKLEHVRRFSSLRDFSYHCDLCRPRYGYALPGNGQRIKDADGGYAPVHRQMTCSTLPGG